MTSESAAPLFIFTQPEVLWYTIARESRRGALSRVRQESGTVELEQAKKRVEELRAVIEKNNRLYYDQDAPELEDFAALSTRTVNWSVLLPAATVS